MTSVSENPNGDKTLLGEATWKPQERAVDVYQGGSTN